MLNKKYKFSFSRYIRYYGSMYLLMWIVVSLGLIMLTLANNSITPIIILIESCFILLVLLCLLINRTRILKKSSLTVGNGYVFYQKIKVDGYAGEISLGREKIVVSYDFKNVVECKKTYKGLEVRGKGIRTTSKWTDNSSSCKQDEVQKVIVPQYYGEINEIKKIILQEK